MEFLIQTQTSNTPIYTDKTLAAQRVLALIIEFSQNLYYQKDSKI